MLNEGQAVLREFGLIEVPDGTTLDTFDEVMECRHEYRQLRRRVIRNGEIRYHRQCVLCGDAGNAVSKREAEAGLEVPAFDDDLGLRYSKWLYGKRRELQQREFEVSHQKWLEEKEVYWKSYDWKAKRAKVIARCGNVCEGCGDCSVQVVHHLVNDDYENAFLFNLVGLCHACHHRIHGRDKA